MVTVSRYLGSFIVDQAADTEGLVETVRGWTTLVETMAGMALQHLQTEYAGIKSFLQQEWAFVQCITP